MNRIYDNLSGIQHQYMSELDKSTELIGLDRNRIKLTVEKPNPEVINSQVEVMYIRAQEFLQGFRKHRIEVANPQLSYENLGLFIEGTKKAQLRKYQNDTDISQYLTTIDATAQSILEDLHSAYNHGLKRGFEEISLGSNHIFDEIPSFLYSSIIAKVNTIDPLPLKK